MAKQDDYVRYTVRVPAELYDRLKDAAGEKSVNAEIVERLERSFGQDALMAMLADDTLLVNHFPAGLAERLESASLRHGRSVEEEVIQALEAAYPPAPELTDFFEQWIVPLEFSKGENRQKLLEEANAEAREYWPDRNIGFRLEGDEVKFLMSKKLTLRSSLSQTDEIASSSSGRVRISEKFKPEPEPLPRPPEPNNEGWERLRNKPSRKKK